jgi:uncharacterized cupredoxin-like copper-binding protein
MLICMSVTRTHRLAAVAAAALALPLVAACGSGGGSTSSGSNTLPAAPSITVIGTDNRFDATAYTAKAGEVTIAYYNKGNVTHTLVIKQADGTRLGDRLFLTPGKSAGMAVNLASGTYDMYCDVPGHRESGMDSTLTIT